MKVLVLSKFTAMIFAILTIMTFSTRAVFVRLAYNNFNTDHLSLLALWRGFSLPFFTAIGQINKKSIYPQNFHP